jgi:ubiquinone/menaquinone biosynthesis C-methylase UbiE
VTGGEPAPSRQPRFDAQSVRESWDRAADGYDAAQSSGLDFYRYDFFGPAQVAMCGDVRGMRLLDVGCGSGYFAREMATRGARVTGVDISARMIGHAARHAAEAGLEIEHRVGDATQIAAQFAAGTFDMATSCLALQDMPDVPAVLRGVHAVLRPGARFVASITHPCTDTPFRRWERDAAGAKRWLCVDRYFDREAMEFAWIRWADPPFSTVGLHATLEDWLGWVLDAGFELRAFREPRPTTEALRARPELEDAARMPYYVMLDLVRR